MSRSGDSEKRILEDEDDRAHVPMNVARRRQREHVVKDRVLVGKRDGRASEDRQDVRDERFVPLLDLGMPRRGGGSETGAESR
jgi:hypothetical protein